MPFIIKDRRRVIDAYGLSSLRDRGEIEMGDICYLYYKDMVKKWRKRPGWTTAHNIYKEIVSKFPCSDGCVAERLAWQVFFQLYVIPYELKKREKNGDIE